MRWWEELLEAVVGEDGFGSYVRRNCGIGEELDAVDADDKGRVAVGDDP